MRFDSIGLWWEDQERSRTRNVLERPMPSIPETGWRAPTTYPNLSTAVVLAIDTETFDPGLLTNGPPGWARNKGHVVGFSVGALFSDGSIHDWYFPIRHETRPEDNLDPEKSFAWLKDTLSNAKQAKVGANLQYDIGWLRHEGVAVPGELYDVQYAEALLDESAKVALEVIAQKYLDEGKESNLLYQWLSDWFGGEPTPKQRKYIYKAPPCLVGPYAESDASLPLKLIRVMLPLMEKERLLSVFYMECRLINLMVDMRFEGVTVDVAKAEELQDTLHKEEIIVQERLDKLAGFEVNINAADSLADVFTMLNLPFSKTAKGNPSFTKAFLEGVNHPVGDMIREIRKLSKLRGTFIESYILNSHIDGKVYGQFHQLRGDSGGTRSGRYSSSTPNLQNIPSRDDILAPMIRGLFIPDLGHLAWRKYDYSQIEYRMLIHFAVGVVGQTIREYFWANPDTDYHIYAQQLVKDQTGILIPRKPIKSINFGLIYGMGLVALSNTLGMTKKEAKKLVDAYFQGVPFAKPTMDACMAEAQETGVITTIMGRKSRFTLWEKQGWHEDSPSLPYEKAVRQYGSNIQRAYTHKALNRRLQGSAADLMKKAMLQCYEDGVFAVTGVPRLTVHDELDFSDPGGVDEAFLEMKRIMEDAMPELQVPVKADGEIGPNWGNIKAIKE